MPKKIPLTISSDEQLVRCIGYDLYFSRSKNRLSSTCFFPPAGSNEISILRLLYSDFTKCKKHAKSILKNNYKYCGLSSTKAQDLEINCDEYKYKDGSRATTKLSATPLDSDKSHRDIDKDIIYDTDDGLPYHADLIYNWTPTKGKRAPTVIKRIATKLSKRPPTTFHEDINPDEDEWFN